MEVASLLLDHGALINIPGFENDTPLHDAVANGHMQVASLLVARGANVSIRYERDCFHIYSHISLVSRLVFPKHGNMHEDKISY